MDRVSDTKHESQELEHNFFMTAFLGIHFSIVAMNNATALTM
jgi:hypothetical protein